MVPPSYRTKQYAHRHPVQTIEARSAGEAWRGIQRFA